MAIFVGIDVGTSGCRAVAIDEEARPIASARVVLPPPERDGAHAEQDAEIWWRAVSGLISELNRRIDAGDVAALAVDGTSGTLMLCRSDGTPLTSALMYDDARADREAGRIAAVAQADTAACSPTSSLAKLLWLADRSPAREFVGAHQADWIAGRIAGRFGFSDENNALKLGYDAVSRRWPRWIDEIGLDRNRLPEVLEVGAPIGEVSASVAAETGLPRSALVLAGTTDSTASAVAAGAAEPGDAVTVLGSTLVVKVVTKTPVGAPASGVYSHRFGDWWLAGGASNSGGAVIAQFFSDRELLDLEAELDPATPTGLDYYPLSRPGERFPVRDPGLQARLTPRPRSPGIFLQGLLEGIAAIEAAGYRLLADMGCPFPRRVLTIGGGARNKAWMEIRRRALGCPVSAAPHQEAAYGTALIARQGMNRLRS